MTRVGVLTPPGTGAIATVAVVGPGAWAAVRTLFRPAGRPLPEVPEAGRFWFGKLGDGAADEVVVAVTQTDTETRVEVHCHGGRQVVRWVMGQFVSAGCTEVDGWDISKPTDSNRWAFDDRALEPLSRAPTLRTALILLDQYHGAFARAVADIEQLPSLAAHTTLGRHLTTPYTVAVVGPPNVGKSSLINALAGYQRSAVAPVAGTTRDAVTVAVALDGWPVTLTDTAGLRDTSDELEAAGVDLARQVSQAADLTIWVLDLSTSDPVFPSTDGSLLVANKADLSPGWNPSLIGGNPILVSATTGIGITELVDCITRRLVPIPPTPGAAIPYTDELCAAVEVAWRRWQAGDLAAARQALLPCLSQT